MSIRRLRDDVEDAKAAARGDAAAANTPAPLDARPPRLTTSPRYETRLELADSLWLTDNLHRRLAELALLLRSHYPRMLPPRLRRGRPRACGRRARPPRGLQTKDAPGHVEPNEDAR